MHALHISVILIFRVYILCEILNDFWKDIIDYKMFAVSVLLRDFQKICFEAHTFYTTPTPPQS